MLQRTTIFRSDELENLERPSQKNFSQRISNICDRYNAIIRLHYPVKIFEFTELEMLKDCFSGKILRPAGLIRNLISEVEDAISINRLDVKWEVNAEKLLDKLKKLDYVQNVALIEHVEEYWDVKERES